MYSPNSKNRQNLQNLYKWKFVINYTNNVWFQNCTKVILETCSNKFAGLYTFGVLFKEF